MASSDDYVGMEFGSFRIEGSIGRGAEAEVFQICNRESGRKYVMRLDANDDAIWESEPVNPPRNYSLEAKNVRGSWFATLQYEKLGRTKDGWRFNVPRIFGVKELTYLIPVSSPFSIRGSVNFDVFLDLAPPDDLYLFETWEDIVLTMLGDADLTSNGHLPAIRWQRRWDVLLGGEILQRAMARYMAGGSLSAEERESVLGLIRAGDGQGRELAHNLLLRLCGSVSRGRITLDAARKTAGDRFFRENLTLRDFSQIVSCWAILSEMEPKPYNSLYILSEILSALKQQPLTWAENSDDFEEASRQDFSTFIESHNLSRFSLFFQELAGADQPFPVMEGDL